MLMFDRSAVLGFITVDSSSRLFERVPALLNNGADWFGTACDLGLVVYGVSSLAGQAGLKKSNVVSDGADLSGLSCGVTLSIGREQGTWMPQDWGASGARLSLPLNVLRTNRRAEKRRTRSV